MITIIIINIRKSSTGDTHLQSPSISNAQNAEEYFS